MIICATAVCSAGWWLMVYCFAVYVLSFLVWVLWTDTLISINDAHAVADALGKLWFRVSGFGFRVSGFGFFATIFMLCIYQHTLVPW